MIKPHPGNWFDPISIEEILAAQSNDNFYPKLHHRLNQRDRLSFFVDDNGILVRRGDKGNQIVSPHSFEGRILYINHYSKLAGHPGSRKLYHRI